MKTMHLEFPPYVRDGRAYNRTPPTCPGSGYWTTMLEFTYRDGVTETVESRSPCERPKLRIGHRDVIARGGATLVELRCAGPPGARCEGRLGLEPTTRDSRLTAGAEARAIRFALAAGTKRKVRARVPPQTVARLARRRKAVVRAVARLDDGRMASRMLSVFAR